MSLASLIDQFEARAVRCSSGAELSCLLEDASRELGFDYVALLHHASLGGGGTGGRAGAGTRLIRIDNYPAGWAAEFVTDRLAPHDPVHLASGRTNIGFPWEQLARLIPLTRRHHDILDRSGRHGIGPGFTVPANVPGEPRGSCSFAVRWGRALPARCLPAAELIGAHAFRAALRLRGYPAAGWRPRLSRRELQCLRLVARGKSDWEIARILGLSPETVRQYVKRARAAYDVATRTQLVVHGLRDGWIAFDDAIPPTGGMG